jgi:uncharacterized protein YacL
MVERVIVRLIGMLVAVTIAFDLSLPYMNNPALSLISAFISVLAIIFVDLTICHLMQRRQD